MIPPMAVTEKCFAALRDPLDWSSKFFSRKKHANVFWEQENFHAKSAAYVIASDKNLIFFYVKDLSCKYSAHNMHALTGNVERESTIRLNGTDSSTCFHRGGHNAVIYQVEFDNLFGFRKSFICVVLIACFPIKTNISFGIAPNLAGVRCI